MSEVSLQVSKDSLKVSSPTMNQSLRSGSIYSAGSVELRSIFGPVEPKLDATEQEHFWSEQSFQTDTTDVGAIDLAFPENPDSEYIQVECLPLGYYTLSAKERLLLVFAENFRRQFNARSEYAKRGPLVLAPKNECGVQKFVCTTIRPTSFLIPKLIGSWEECAKFVADFIVYEPLENPLLLPQRLMSPDTLLRKRRGNSYEMATLLCSMLAGAGFAAVVVSGSATIETTLNDQRRVECPFIPTEVSSKEDSAELKSNNKYVLKGKPDLRSKFLMEEESKVAQKELEEKENLKRIERERDEESARRPADQFRGRRMHAWVAVIENAPWSFKPQEKAVDDQGNEITPTLKTFFIEPSTGFRHAVTSTKYLRIESVWNQHNYFINRQLPTENGLADMEWDLTNTDHWEQFLPTNDDELTNNRPKSISESNLDESNHDSKLVEKFLDILPSWVEKLHISVRDFTARFPNEKKQIFYQKAFYERFAPYHNADGLVTKLTAYEDFYYKQPTTRWEWYKNRLDCLDMIKIDFESKQVVENFRKGRRDCLKFFAHNAEPNRPKTFEFFHQPRLDCLKKLELKTDRYIYHYEDREDLCYYQEFQFEPKKGHSTRTKSLIEITEKFHRNKNLPTMKDIAIRKFYLKQDKIFLQFQYGDDAITASTREFIKPPKPDYGEEIVFDPALTSGYIANPLETPATPAELYCLLLSQLKREQELKKEFEKRSAELEDLLSTRKEEMLGPRLKFSIFDPLRNEGARKIHLRESEEEQLRKELSLLEEPDFLLPYLVSYENRMPTYEESRNAYNACLLDVKERYSKLLTELQRRYEQLTSESHALHDWMERYEEKFDNSDYDRLVKEAKEIESNRHLVQQRLIRTHEEAQRKFEKIKSNLEADNRLNLKTTN